MKEKIKKVTENIKRHKIISAVALMVIIAVIAGIAGRSGNGKEYVNVDSGEVVVEVAVTGKVKALRDVSLSFEKAGRIAYAPFSIGDAVSASQVLASLDKSQANADLLKARAALQVEEVALTKLKQSAPNDYNDAKANLVASIEDAYVKTDDAVRNNADQFFKNPRTSANYLEFSFIDGGTIYNFPIDTDLKIKINNERYALELSLNKWQAGLLSVNSAPLLDSFVAEAESVLKQANIFLNDLALAANSIVPSEFQYEATISGYKTTITGARSGVGGALASLIAAKQSWNAAPQIITGGQGGYDDVLSQEAKVAQAEATVKAAEVDLLKTEIRSPIDGVLSVQNGEVGEIATVNTPIVGIISDKQFEIEADVSEVNVGKIGIGNEVSITFDAFLGQVFTGEVFSIEPSETIVDGVVNFKTKIRIPENSVGLKNGLTANLKIKSASKTDVLRIPQYALKKRDDVLIARVQTSDGVEERVVSTGLIGSNGFVEIVSGLNGGERVLISSE